MRKLLESRVVAIKGSKLLVVLALMLGSFVYQIIQKVIDGILKLFMPLTSFNPFDEYFLYDSDSPAIAACLFRCQKFDWTTL